LTLQRRRIRDAIYGGDGTPENADQKAKKGKKRRLFARQKPAFRPRFPGFSAQNAIFARVLLLPYMATLSRAFCVASPSFGWVGFTTLKDLRQKKCTRDFILRVF
jgi:hypothetical protein